jgi:NDP-sugar pyrophosphorylase family protein
MISLSDFIQPFPIPLEIIGGLQPWEITGDLPAIIRKLLAYLDDQYTLDRGIAIHHTATVENGAIIKSPAIIGRHCFVGSHAYLREGVFLAESVSIGPGCEIKASVIGQGSSLAHFNFIGNSIIGNRVNFEAGSVIANHYNERANKRIFVLHQAERMDTGTEKFGALAGDDCKIGANAVLSPGTVLKPFSVVKRLELIDQLPPGDLEIT